MSPRDMTNLLGSKPVTEFTMALIVAMHCWRGTSLIEGAFYYMDQARCWPQHKEG